MARNKKNQLKVVGLVLLVIGVGLAIWGYQLSGSMGSQLTKAFSGSQTDRVMMMYIGGAAAVVAGFFLLSKK